MPKIVFTYDLEKCELTADASGFHGHACMKTTEKLLEGLQTKVLEQRKKPEFNQVAVASKDCVAVR